MVSPISNNYIVYISKQIIKVIIIILARRIDLVIISQKKKTNQIVDFAKPADHGVKIKKKTNPKDYQVLGSCMKTKKAIEHENNAHIN